MAQSDQSKKGFTFDWLAVLLILIFGGVSVFMGTKLHKKDIEHIAEQAVWGAQRDSLQVKIEALQESLKRNENALLLATAETAEAHTQTEVYKARYQAIKDQVVEPSPCDTFPPYEACEELLQIHENYETILKRNVTSYAYLADTLRAQNKVLMQQQVITTSLVASQEEELNGLRGKLRRSRVYNYAVSGVLAGAVVVLLVK